MRLRPGELLVLAALAAAPFSFQLNPVGPAFSTGHTAAALLLLPLLAGGALCRGEAACAAFPAVCAAGLLAVLRWLLVPVSCEPGIGLIEAERAAAAAAAAWAAARCGEPVRRAFERMVPWGVVVLVAWGAYQWVEFPRLLAEAPSLPTGGAGRLASGRVFGPFALPAMYSAVLAGAFLCVVTDASRSRAVRAAACAAALFGMYLAGSLAGPVAVFAGLLLTPGYRRFAAIGAVAVALVALPRLGGDLGLASAHNPFRLRALLWVGAVEAWAAEPLLGWGTGGFLSAYPAFQPPLAPLDADPHNRPLLLLVENGPLGAALWFAALAPLASPRTPAGRFGFGLAAVSLVDVIEIDAGISVLLFACAGFEAAARRASLRRTAWLAWAAPLVAAFTLYPTSRFAAAERAWAEAAPLAAKRAGLEARLSPDFAAPSLRRLEVLSVLRFDADRRAVVARFLRQFPGGRIASLRLYDEAIRLAPRRARFYAERAMLRAALGRFDEADSDAQRARALAPRDPFVQAVVVKGRAEKGATSSPESRRAPEGGPGAPR